MHFVHTNDPFTLIFFREHVYFGGRNFVFFFLFKLLE